jgi:hypothetical protein
MENVNDRSILMMFIYLGKQKYRTNSKEALVDSGEEAALDTDWEDKRSIHV